MSLCSFCFRVAVVASLPKFVFGNRIYEYIEVRVHCVHKPPGCSGVPWHIPPAASNERRKLMNDRRVTLCVESGLSYSKIGMSELVVRVHASLPNDAAK
eukprot:980393-Pleurochrysis_carterae.AAC.2